MIISKVTTRRVKSMILLYVKGVLVGMYPDSTPLVKAINRHKAAI